MIHRPFEERFASIRNDQARSTPPACFFTFSTIRPANRAYPA
jgi:hypothetical protein